MNYFNIETAIPCFTLSFLSQTLSWSLAVNYTIVAIIWAWLQPFFIPPLDPQIHVSYNWLLCLISSIFGYIISRYIFRLNRLFDFEKDWRIWFAYTCWFVLTIPTHWIFEVIPNLGSFAIVWAIYSILGLISFYFVWIFVKRHEEIKMETNGSKNGEDMHDHDMYHLREHGYESPRQAIGVGLYLFGAMTVWFITYVIGLWFWAGVWNDVTIGIVGAFVVAVYTAFVYFFWPLRTMYVEESVETEKLLSTY